MNWIAQVRMPHIATFAIFYFFKVPLMMVAALVCWVFLKPFQLLREWMADFSLSADCFEVDMWTQQLVVTKLGFGDKSKDKAWYVLKKREIARITEKL
jgi:hypothetical protein